MLGEQASGLETMRIDTPTVFRLLLLCLLPFPLATLVAQPVHAQNSLSEKVYARAEEIFERANVVHYRHLHEDVQKQVWQSANSYECCTDCSGFVSYVINSVAPSHYSYVCRLTQRRYPHAAVYARFFMELPANASSGWFKIRDFKDLKRGDIIAWERQPKQSDRQQGHARKGHVMIVAQCPGSTQQEIIGDNQIRFVDVYVIDSSAVRHFPPESFPPCAHHFVRDGLGKGTIRLILDDDDKVVGYWEGPYSEARHKPIVRPTYTNVLGFARLVDSSAH